MNCSSRNRVIVHEFATYVLLTNTSQLARLARTKIDATAVDAQIPGNAAESAEKDRNRQSQIRPPKSDHRDTANHAATTRAATAKPKTSTGHARDHPHTAKPTAKGMDGGLAGSA